MVKKNSFQSDDFITLFFDEVSQEYIFNLFRELAEKTGAIYLSYVYEDVVLKKRCGFTTNPDWSKRYIGDRLIDKCHLWQEVTKSFLETERKNYILPWDTIKPADMRQRSISYERTDHEIGINGISFCSEFNKSREYLAIAPDLKNLKFQYYLSQHMDIVKYAVSQIRQLIAAQM